MFTKAEFIISAVSNEQNPNHDNLDEFVFLGRSNVGKSSFINALTNRKNLARTSGKPGKTITINYYLIDDDFYLVDVPGYGYASRSKAQRDDFGRFILEYLMDNDNLQGAFLLIDSRHKPTEDDILMYNFLQELHIPTVVIGTKVDKVGTTKRASHLKQIKKALKITNNKAIYLTSSFSKEGIKDIQNILK